MSKPPVMAAPLMAPMTGLGPGGSGPRRSMGVSSRGRVPVRVPDPAPSSLRSSPAQKAGSAPVRMITLTSSSAWAALTAATRSLRRAPERALRASGWQRRGPSLLVFVVVLAVMGLTAVALWSSITDVVPDVGKDKQGEDPWQDPVGIEKVGDFQVAHIPDCAAAPIVRIALWDEHSKPYWEVSGPAIPMASFAIGATPQGFEVDTPYTAPPPGAVLRLAVVRTVKGVAGVRF